MASLVSLDLRPDSKKLRQFGFVALGAFSLLALLAWLEVGVFRGGLGAARVAVSAALAGLGLVSGVLAWLYPAGNRPLYVALSLVAFPIGLVLSQLLLVFLFVVVIGPFAVARKLWVGDPMRVRYDRDAHSYWTVPKSARSKASYFRQY